MDLVILKNFFRCFYWEVRGEVFERWLRVGSVEVFIVEAFINLGYVEE